jgi:hypothetical protein
MFHKGFPEGVGLGEWRLGLIGKVARVHWDSPGDDQDLFLNFSFWLSAFNFVRAMDDRSSGHQKQSGGGNLQEVSK